MGIDARFALRYPRRGIGTYSLNLLIRLVFISKDIKFLLYTDRVDSEGILPDGPNVEVRILQPSPYPLWEQIALPLAVLRDRLDLLHTLGNTAPLLLPGRTQLVLSLMDVMFLQTGEFIPLPKTLYQKLGRAYRALVAPINARRASTVITISDFSREDILQLISGVSPHKVVTIHLACDPRFTISQQENIKVTNRPFLLCLGAEDPRKNTLRIVQGYLAALRNFGLEHNLVISGYANWEGSPADLLVKAERAETRVKFMSFIAVEDLVAHYQRASALLYISLYEGFGIPVLEAFKSGCPVIASNSTSIPEVGGDAVIYVDPTDVSDIERAIALLCKNPSLQSDLRQKGFRRSFHFSWEKVARETVGVYVRLLVHSEKVA